MEDFRHMMEQQNEPDTFLTQSLAGKRKYK